MRRTQYTAAWLLDNCTCLANSDQQMDRQTDILQQHSPRYAQHRVVIKTGACGYLLNVHLGRSCDVALGLITGA